MKTEDIFRDLNELERKSKISKTDLLNVLRSYSMNISVFDLMRFNSTFVNGTEHVPNEFFKKVHETSFKSVFNSIKSFNDETIEFDGDVDRDRLDDSIRYLEGRLESDDDTIQFGIIIGLYRIFIEEKPIHPLDMPFPGDLKIVEENGHYHCPARKNNIKNPVAFCKMCIAEELEF